MRKVLLIVQLLILPLLLNAQQVRPANATQIYHELNQLKNLTSVLYIAAHPDDENTRMLTWLVNEKHIPTAYLSLTRGDGGQNILGPHLGPSLGLIRTHELLEARKLDGAQQFFTRAVDFGYSKTAEETFKHWDEDKLIEDAVWVIRRFRPDVIITRFPPNEQAGHGQHAASAIIAHKAFNAAGDRSKYPEQLRYVEAWQPKRLLFNAYRFGSRNTTNDGQFKLDVGQYNTLLGMGYGELAGISRSIHRSQGAGTRSIPGVQTEYLELIDGDTFSTSIFDGINTSWERAGLKNFDNLINLLISQYDFNHPEKLLPALLELYKRVKTSNDNPWRYQKMQELQQIILHSAGFMAEVHTEQPEAVRGETLPFTINFIKRSGDVPVQLTDFSCTGVDTVCQLNMPEDVLVSFTRNITIPQNAPLTEPYWLSKPQTDAAHYPMPDQMQAGLPNTQNQLVAQAKVKIGDETFLVPIPLSYKTLDATHGDVVEQLRVVPNAIINFTSAFYLAKDDGSFTTNVHIHANKDINNAALKVYSDVLVKDVPNISLKKGGDTTIRVLFGSDYVEKSRMTEFEMFAQLTDVEGNIYNKQQVLIKYEHLPTLQYFTGAHTKVLRKTWVSTAKRLGYIEGAGDDVSEILRFAGFEVDILKSADVNLTNLKKYDAVMVGIRAVNVVDDIGLQLPVLMNYVKDGGTLVMQYNTAHRMNTNDIGPYPIKLSYGRVTEEDADVTVLDPEHKLLNTPNKITKADFDNWVQERGLYFASEWDKQYTPLFSMHDTGEDALKGSTLYTPYGKGHYIYTPLSFFRQLPAGNTGAVRLLCNFLSVK